MVVNVGESTNTITQVLSQASKSQVKRIEARKWKRRVIKTKVEPCSRKYLEK
jgi:hypothetical protein